MLLDRKDKEKIRMTLDFNLGNWFNNSIDILIPTRCEDRVYFKAYTDNHYLINYEIGIAFEGHLDNDREIFDKGKFQYKDHYELVEKCYKRVLKILESK